MLQKYGVCSEQVWPYKVRSFKTRPPEATSTNMAYSVQNSGARSTCRGVASRAGIAAGGGLLWIADTNNHAIRAVDPRTGATRTITIAGLEPPASIERQAAGESVPAMPGGPLAGFGALYGIVLTLSLLGLIAVSKLEHISKSGEVLTHA